MLKDYIGKYYFDGNYNCAESVLRAANDYYELNLHDRDMILIGGFGAGMQTGNTCGAVLAAISVLSMKYVEAKAHESEDINAVTTLFIEKFEKAAGTMVCADLRAKYFVEGQRCLNTVNIACDVLEETIAEYENSKN